MRKLFYVTTIMVIALVSFLGVTYSYEYNDDNSLKFELIGPYELYLDVNTEYNEYGINVIRNGYNVSSLVKIDNSSVDINKLGEYKVKYEIDNNGNTEYIYRIVKVIVIYKAMTYRPFEICVSPELVQLFIVFKTDVFQT